MNNIPYEILDEIYKCCDIGTKVLIRRICKLFHQRYVKYKCPFNYPETYKLIYNGNVVKKGNIAINNKHARITKIRDLYFSLIYMYKLDQEDVLTFNIIIGEKYHPCAVSRMHNEMYITLDGKSYVWGDYLAKYCRHYSKRTFTLIDENYQYHGIYKGHAPRIAAKRAFAQLLKNNCLVTAHDVPFIIKETTQGRGGKVYHFTGTRLQINPKQVMLSSGKMITFNYTNIITQVPKKPKQELLMIDNDNM